MVFFVSSTDQAENKLWDHYILKDLSISWHEIRTPNSFKKQ